MTIAESALSPVTRQLSREDWVMRIGVSILILFLITIIALPIGLLLSKSFQNSEGQFVGLANYIVYFSTPTLVQSIWNSLFIAITATTMFGAHANRATKAAAPNETFRR